MNRELLSRAVGDIDDRYIAEACRGAAEDASASSGRIIAMKKKRIITFALAAVLMLSLSVVAYAAYSAVATPQAAEKVAREQIEVWKELGLLPQAADYSRAADDVQEIEELDGGSYWYGRLFPHSYDVRWYIRSGLIDPDGPKYGGHFTVDTLTGKIMGASIDVIPDPGVEPVREEKAEGNTWYFYDNFEDIFPDDMTVDRYCSLLAEYWGFSGHTLADTVDDFYQTSFEAVDGSAPMRELNADTRANYYLTVFFEGDQEGAPMYLQLHQFPGYVTMTLGNRHAVG